MMKEYIFFTEHSNGQYVNVDMIDAATMLQAERKWASVINMPYIKNRRKNLLKGTVYEREESPILIRNTTNIFFKDYLLHGLHIMTNIIVLDNSVSEDVSFIILVYKGGTYVKQFYKITKVDLLDWLNELTSITGNIYDMKRSIKYIEEKDWIIIKNHSSFNCRKAKGIIFCISNRVLETKKYFTLL